MRISGNCRPFSRRPAVAAPLAALIALSLVKCSPTGMAIGAGAEVGSATMEERSYGDIVDAGLTVTAERAAPARDLGPRGGRAEKATSPGFLAWEAARAAAGWGKGFRRSCAMAKPR